MANMSRREVAPSVRTPLWSVVLPKDARTAFFVTITAALFGSLWIIIRGTKGQPSLTLGLAAGVLFLYLVVIISHHLLSPKQVTRRLGSGGGKKRGPAPRPFRSDDRSARIGASRR